jgi:hypothetical protein
MIDAGGRAEYTARLYHVVISSLGGSVGSVDTVFGTSGLFTFDRLPPTIYASGRKAGAIGTFIDRLLALGLIVAERIRYSTVFVRQELGFDPPNTDPFTPECFQGCARSSAYLF